MAGARSPLAKNAGEAVRRSAEDAAAWARPRAEEVAAWARPRVDDARAWAAPRLERSGIAVQESIAPAISDAMITAARKLDVKPARRRRRWAGVLATVTLVAAAASAAARGAAAAQARRVRLHPGRRSGRDAGRGRPGRRARPGRGQRQPAGRRGLQPVQAVLTGFHQREAAAARSRRGRP